MRIFKLTQLILLFFIAITSMAQVVSGVVSNDQGKPIAGASVGLLKKEDSSVLKYTITDASGKFEFGTMTAGDYFIRISCVGFIDKQFAVFEIQPGKSANFPALSLNKATENLKEITVISRKPVVEVKADRIIMNVEASVNAVGQNLIELLRKSPGVMVDKDNNISLSGKNGVKIYIDGRQLPLNGTDLSEYLKTIQSTEVESIEMITNPSSKYDASGNAGIINIKLKKNKSFGTNGSVTAGYNIGTYSKYNTEISLNHRNKHINLFGAYNYNTGPNESYLFLQRRQLDTLFNQHTTIKNTSTSHGFKAGLDYFINKENTIGVLLSGTLTDYTLLSNSNTDISYIPTNTVNRILVANNSSSGKRNNGNLNLNYRFADSTGHELNIDADYGIYYIRSNQLQPNFYYDPSGVTLLYSDIFNMLSPTDINIYSIKTDYEKNFKKGRLGIGGKISYVNSDNDFRQYYVFPASKLYDTLHSNHFIYKENVNAVYANYNRNFKGWTMQAGLRVENTNARGVSNGFKPADEIYITYDSVVDKHYTDLFPSAAITLNKNPLRQWTLSYSRRIDRPAYQDLNPFEFKLDEYTFNKGNTQLRPQYTKSVGLTYMYKFKLVTTLNYSHVKDVFTQLVDTTDKSKAFLTRQNLATQDITSLNISYPFQYKWYGVFANLNTFYTLYKADFGPGRSIHLSIFSLNVFAQQTIRLGKGWTGEITSFFTSPSLWQGYSRTKSLWSVDGGLQKTVLKNKGSLKASVSDIFNSFHWSSTGHFAGQTTDAKGGWESRQFKLYFTYRFGSSEVKMARQHQQGSEEESKRAQSQGGALRSN